MVKDLKDINNNMLAKKHRERIAKLSKEGQLKWKKLDESDSKEYQLKVIKRKRTYPEIGDIFQINPFDEVYLYGIVINNHVDSNGMEDLLVIMIFAPGKDIRKCVSEGIKKEDLFIGPEIVHKMYWTRGYFYNVDHYNELINIDSYGFFRILDWKFYDEYGNHLNSEPELLGTYGVATDIGIASLINEEFLFREEGV